VGKRIDEALEMSTKGMELVTKMAGEHELAELEAMKEMRARIEGRKNNV
jgi:hypothetical protein